jgi:hypothetical protein
MAQSDLLAAHLEDTTSSVGNLKKVAKIGREILWVFCAVAFGLIFSLAQMHQRNKSDAKAVEEKIIPKITLSST